MIKYFNVIFLLVTTFCAYSQSFKENAVARHLPFQKVSISSSVLNETLDIYIQIPFKYHSEFNQNSRYPVLYTLDAPVGLPLVSGVLEPLNGYNNAPQMIIVGISTSNRGRDFTPTPDPNYEEISGGADKYLSFIEQDVIPYIENHYRTEKFRILSGHSYGGLLVSHSFYKKPNLFQAHFANSPSFFWDSGKTVSNIVTFVKKNPMHKNYLYLNIGNEGNPESESPEGVQMLTGVQKIESELADIDTPNLRFKFEYFPEEPHQNTQIYGIIGALRGLYPQWSIPYKTSVEGYESVLAHFNELSILYGYKIEPKEWQMFDEGIEQLMYLHNPVEAIKYFSYNIKHQPSSYRSRFHIVDALLQVGKNKDALTHLDILLDRDDLTDDEREQLTKKRSKII
jgi:predicted alpha/beta superfamily hydrolase